MSIKKYLSLFASSIILAQAATPDAGALSQDIEKQLVTQPQKTLPKPQLQKVQQEDKKTSLSKVKVLINGFKISGNSVITTQAIEVQISKYIGKSLSFDELQDVTRAVAEYYRENGFSARAFLPPQEVQGGIIEIMILEGKLSAIEIDTATSKRLKPEIAQNIIENSHPVGATLETKKLERGLMILGDTPGIRPSSSLSAGENAGDSKLKVKLEDSDLVNGSVSYSNAGSKSTAPHQFSLSLGLNSPASIGDQLTFQGMKTRGIDYGRVAYSLPFGTSGLRFGINVTKMEYEVVDGLEADGNSKSKGWSFTYPFIRSGSANLSGSLSYDAKEYFNRSSGTPISDKTNDVYNTSLNGSLYDDKGQTGYGITLTTGEIDLSGLASDLQADQSTAQTDGHYTKTVLNLSRTQIIADDALFSFSGIFQKANTNLDSGEKLYLGGASGIRAYPSNEAGGDEGWMLNLDLTKNLPNGYSLSYFYDIGEIKQHHNLYTGWQGNSTAANRYKLKGMGVAVGYAKNGWSGKLSAAFKVGDNPNASITDGSDNDGTDKNPRIWANITKVF